MTRYMLFNDEELLKLWARRETLNEQDYRDLVQEMYGRGLMKEQG
jgi:hypothetical protein